jgi:hypothetical protein
MHGRRLTPSGVACESLTSYLGDFLNVLPPSSNGGKKKAGTERFRLLLYPSQHTNKKQNNKQTTLDLGFLRFL